MDTVLPNPGFVVEPSEILSSRSRREITKRVKDAQEGSGCVTPAESGGESFIKTARPRWAIRKIGERRHPFEPPKDIRSGANIPENGDEGTAQSGVGVASYKALQRAGVIHAEGGSGERVTAKVEGHTGAEHRSSELIGENTGIARGGRSEVAKPPGKVDGARYGTSANTN